MQQLKKKKKEKKKTFEDSCATSHISASWERTKNKNINTKPLCRRHARQTAAALCQPGDKRQSVKCKRRRSAAETADAEPGRAGVSVPLITSLLPAEPNQVFDLERPVPKNCVRVFFFPFHNFCFARGPLVITHAIAALAPPQTPPPTRRRHDGQPSFHPLSKPHFLSAP